MFKSLTVRASLLVFLLQASIAVSQQPAAQDQETVRVGTAAVQVEAIVTDKTGKRIKGLTAGDFEVLDESQPQKLDYFAVVENSLVSNSTPTPSGSSSANPAATTPLARPYKGRVIALIFDDLSLSQEDFVRARQSLIEYVKTKLTDNDLVALVSTGGSFASLQQFTNDKQRILSAINRIGIQSNRAERFTDRKYNMTPAEAVRIDAGDDQVLNAVMLRAASSNLADQQGAGAGAFGTEPQGRGAPASDGRPDPNLKLQIQAKARSLLADVAQGTRNNMHMLDALLRGMADLPGRKLVVLMSESFSDLAGSSEGLSNQVIQLIDRARRSGVSIYALDAAGLKTSNVNAATQITGVGLQAQSTVANAFSDYENMSAARTLVAGTGGELIANTNSLAAGLDKAIEDSSAYYVIGFKPGILDNKFHRLTVSIKGKPDLIVRTRRGYLAINQDTVRGTKIELVAALSSPLPYIDLPLEVIANVVPKDTEQMVVVGLHVGKNYLTLPESTAPDQTASYEVVAWVFATGRDQAVGVIQRTINYDLAKEPEARGKLKAAGFVLVPQPLTLPPGLYQIRAVIREKGTGALGSAYQFFEVPDVKNSKTVSVSSLLLTPEGETTFSGKNSFKSGSQMDVHFVIYNLPRDAAGIEQRLRLLDAHGKVLMDSVLPLAAAATNGPPGQALQGTRLSAPGARGHYALILTLQGGKGKLDVERRADFVIE